MVTNEIHSSLSRPRKAKNSNQQKVIALVLFALVATLLSFIDHLSQKSQAAELSQNSNLIRTTSTVPSSTSSSSKTTKTMGYTKTIIKEGNGEKPGKGQYVTVHCTGYGKNRDMSQKFWSTKDPGQEPFTFRVGMGEVIKAWDESVLTMSIGEVSKVVATPDYAYGASGFPAWGIMPNSDLSFEIEVLKYSFTAP